MVIRLDLHSHSGYAGGVGQITLDKVAGAMVLKGIDVFGTGDCLFPARFAELKNLLVEAEPGLFALSNPAVTDFGISVDKLKTRRFILQTEIILTYADTSPGRKVVHTVLLFPSFQVVEKVIQLLEKWGVKNTIGRPFVKCTDSDDIAKKLFELVSIDDTIEVIPAHVMTPQGIFGSRNHISFLGETFGEAVNLIHAVETGISADPLVLDLLPELDNLTLLSSSDCHSAQLHRLGREFTAMEMDEFSYKAIIQAIRKNNIVFTAEFNPAEGRFFLTGHRGDKKGHNGEPCFFAPNETPNNMICPICRKPLTGGVLARAIELGKLQGEEREYGIKRRQLNYVYMVPLGEIIASCFGIKSPNSTRVVKAYFQVVEALGSEASLWMNTYENVCSTLNGVVPDNVLKGVCSVKKGDFKFDPAGFDGRYGELCLGR